MTTRQANQITTIIGFGISTILTSLFIQSYSGYISQQQMLLSGLIAGGKWAIQLSIAWFILKDKKWLYYRELGLICALGSLILLPYILSPNGWQYFLGSLILCVTTMTGLICWRLPSIGLNKFWPALWFTLLIIAVTLQLTIVFKVFSS